MTATYVPLRKSDPEGHQFIGDAIKGQYLDGQCYEFAIALSESLGWQMIGVFSEWNGEVTIRHTILQSPGGHFDARGWIRKKNIGTPFALNANEFDLVPVTRSDMEAVRPISAHGVRHAQLLSEAYWPRLRWKSSRASRALIFAEELEALSRKHGMWVFGHLPTTWPGLSESNGEDERGYTIESTAIGLGLRINRRLKHED